MFFMFVFSGIAWPWSGGNLLLSVLSQMLLKVILQFWNTVRVVALPVLSLPASSSLQIICGTRQGCAFSLVLFIGTLRPLITIKNNDAIKIIQIRDNQFQLPLPGDGIMDSALSSALLKDSSFHYPSTPPSDSWIIPGITLICKVTSKWTLSCYFCFACPPVPTSPLVAFRCQDGSFSVQHLLLFLQASPPPPTQGRLFLGWVSTLLVWVLSMAIEFYVSAHTKYLQFLFLKHPGVFHNVRHRNKISPCLSLSL